MQTSIKFSKNNYPYLDIESEHLRLGRLNVLEAGTEFGLHHAVGNLHRQVAFRLAHAERIPSDTFPVGVVVRVAAENLQLVAT